MTDDRTERVADKQLIEWVAFGPEEHEVYAVGRGVSTMNGTVESIFLARDGHGLSGYYDRIHVITSTAHFVLPAHNCHEWKLLIKPPEAGKAEER